MDFHVKIAALEQLLGPIQSFVPPFLSYKIEFRHLTNEPLDEWLARTGCEGEEAARVTELLGPQLVDDGKAWKDTKILLRATK